jgi:DNA-binding NarL/FixJ family response regulator
MMTTPIRTVVVDDHPLIVAGARALIENSDDIVCVGDANTGADALKLISQTSPDVSILDVSLSDMSGIALAEQVIREGHSPNVVIMTHRNDRIEVQQALQAGAKGFLQKQSAAHNLLLAVRAVMSGGLFFDPRTAREMAPLAGQPRGILAASPDVGLTVREQDVLRLVALGYSNKEIGDRVHISVKSIETYKARATQKLKLHSRAQIVQFALAHGWMNFH